MSLYHTLFLLAFLVLSGALLIRYVHISVDREFRRLARAVSDKDFRDEELRRMDQILAGNLPLANDVPPVPEPRTGRTRAFAPVLLAVGIILLWGGVFAHEERGLWFYGGIGCSVLAAVLMLIALRRRKAERLARLLRFRADLRRLDGDRAMSASDLTELLKLTPWDDAAWAELSDDLDAEGDLENALDAIRQAARLDPGYGEYRMLEASLALRLGKPSPARAAIDAWKELDEAAPEDPRRAIYRAAVELAEGKREQAAESLRLILTGVDDAPECLDADQALKGVRDLLSETT